MSIVALDIETSSSEGGASSKLHAWPLEPWRKEAYITDIVVTNGSKTQHLVLGEEKRRSQADKDKVQALIDSLEGHEVFAFNAIFDIGYLLAYTDYTSMSKIKWRCAMLLAKWLLNSDVHYNRPYNLASIIEHFLPEDLRTKEFLYMKDEIEDTPEYWYNRAEKDTELTHVLVMLMRSLLPACQRNGYKVEQACLLPMTRGMLEGIEFDPKVIDELSAEYRDKADALLKDLGIPETVVRSPKQLGELLFKDWGLTPHSTSDKTGMPSTSAGDLKHILLESKDERLKKLLAVKELLTILSKYFKGFKAVEKYVGEPVLHANPRIFATITGRYSYSSKNLKKHQLSISLHQLPRRHAGVKKALIAKEGYGFIYFDLSGAEVRVMADKSNDEDMIKAIREGADMHSLLASEIYGTPYETLVENNLYGDDKELKTQRDNGKLTGLSSLYRISGKALAEKFFTVYDLDLPVRTVQSFITTFKRKFAGIPRYWASSIAFTKEEGYAEAYDKRRFHIKKMNWQGESNSLNFPVQGGVSALVNLIIALIDKKFPEMIVAVQVHDSITVSVKVKDDDELKQKAEELNDFVSNIDYSKYYPDINLKVPIGADFAYGYNMKDLVAI